MSGALFICYNKIKKIWFMNFLKQNLMKFLWQQTVASGGDTPVGGDAGAPEVGQSTEGHSSALAKDKADDPPFSPPTGRPGFKRSWANYFFVFLAVVLLAFFVFRGLGRARETKQSETIVQNALAIAKGLQYFASDYERFPQALEFENPAVMRDYFSAFPPQEFISPYCPGTWSYARPASGSYELSFCLPKEAEGFVQGWNKIAGKQEAK